jgi:hypothetical protein
MSRMKAGPAAEPDAVSGSAGVQCSRTARSPVIGTLSICAP